jgi:hypothetical protein
MTSLPTDLKNILDGYMAAPMTFFQNKNSEYLTDALAGFQYYEAQLN